MRIRSLTKQKQISSRLGTIDYDEYVLEGKDSGVLKLRHLLKPYLLHTKLFCADTSSFEKGDEFAQASDASPYLVRYKNLTAFGLLAMSNHSYFLTQRLPFAVEKNFRKNRGEGPVLPWAHVNLDSSLKKILTIFNNHVSSVYTSGWSHSGHPLDHPKNPSSWGKGYVVFTCEETNQEKSFFQDQLVKIPYVSVEEKESLEFPPRIRDPFCRRPFVMKFDFGEQDKHSLTEHLYPQLIDNLTQVAVSLYK